MKTIPSFNRSAGVGLVTAIFLLVVLAALGVAMVSVFNAQQNSATLDLQGARAYQAARAGIEWGLYQRVHNNNCSSTFPLPSTSTLSEFSVTVTCTKIHTNALGAVGTAADALDRWQITAVACNLQPAAGNCATPLNHPDYVRRRIEVLL